MSTSHPEKLEYRVAGIELLHDAVRACVIPASASADLECRQFGLTDEDLHELESWLIAMAVEQVAMTIGAIWPQREHKKRKPGSVTPQEWAAARDSHTLDQIYRQGNWHPVWHKLSSRFTIFTLYPPSLTALPPIPPGISEAEWLAQLLRKGMLRFAYSKSDLHRLCDRLLEDDRRAIEECVCFLELDTRGTWHGRARAMMARRLKHCLISAEQRTRVTKAILGRLQRGEFSEGFKDQLKLAIRFDRSASRDAALGSLISDKAYVRRYAEWVVEQTKEADGDAVGAVR